jgi:glycosyltransferase involved in cell wall biosynthesis
MLSRKLGLENNVHIHGSLSKEDLVRKIRTANVAVLPSLYEGQPIAVLEAMAYKKTVIVYDFPFAHEYVTDGYNGLIAAAKNVEDLAAKICTALSDRKLRLKRGLNAYEDVRKNHNWDTLIQKYIDLYRSLTPHKNHLCEF